MPANEQPGTTAVVTGASRGFGRAIATALSQAGAQVVGVARDRARLEDLRARLGEAFTPVVADATDPILAGQLVDRYPARHPGAERRASPLLRPVHHHTWQTFSRNWEVDVQHVFHWTREALLLPLDPGTNVITLSSGAAISGSPLTGGYAGAKATIRFLTAYAQAESDRQGLGIRFTFVLPKLTAGTDLGAAAVTAYANRQGVDPAAFLDGLGPTLSPEQVGKTILDLIVDPSYDQEAYLLTPTGLAPIG
jgi:NAD(P)-dependent dehydrogenase (short-subunit alcohol dehydrogenase family)